MQLATDQRQQQDAILYIMAKLPKSGAELTAFRNKRALTRQTAAALTHASENEWVRWEEQGALEHDALRASHLLSLLVSEAPHKIKTMSENVEFLASIAPLLDAQSTPWCVSGLAAADAYLKRKAQVGNLVIYTSHDINTCFEELRARGCKVNIRSNCMLEILAPGGEIVQVETPLFQPAAMSPECSERIEVNGFDLPVVPIDLLTVIFLMARSSRYTAIAGELLASDTKLFADARITLESMRNYKVRDKYVRDHSFNPSRGLEHLARFENV